MPVQQAPNVVRPKSNTVSATFSPLPSGPRMFSRGTAIPSNASFAVAVPRMPSFSIRGSTTPKAGHVGRDQKGRDLRVRRGREPACGPSPSARRRSPRW